MHICLLVRCIIFTAGVFDWESVLCYSGGWQPYWNFLRWFLWAYSIRITEGFHLVGSSLHAKKKCPWSLCLPTKSDLLLSYAARLKLSYPATPSSVPPSALATNTPTYTHSTPTRRSLRLSFGRSSLVYFSPESVQNFPDCGLFM